MPLSKAVELTYDESRKLQENVGATLVDVLTPEHFAARHAAGAVNACVFEVSFLDRIADLGLEKQSPVILYGAGPGSMDSRVAGEKLIRAGFLRVHVLTGGLETLRENGHPLEGDSPSSMAPPHPEVSIEDREYTLVPDESRLSWSGANYNSVHHGSIRLSSGTMHFTRPRGRVVLNMTTMANDDLAGDELGPVLDKHLHSDDFFFTSLFPEAVFEMTALSPLHEATATTPNFSMEGFLTVRGMRRAIAFPCHLRSLEQGKLVLLAHTSLNRTDWGVIYGSASFFQHLGYHVVFDHIDVRFRLAFL